MSEYFYPMLTTLCQPMEEMGRCSVEILMDMIHGRGRPRCETVRDRAAPGSVCAADQLSFSHPKGCEK